MSAALVSLTGDPREVVVAATHSPALLDSPSAHLVEIQRGAGHHYGRSLVHALDVADLNDLGRMGLMPSDLLGRPRVILLVEGPHDEELLDAFLGARLRKARVMVIAMHGAKRLPHTVDSYVLFKHTQAHIIAMLDNIAMPRVGEAWVDAQVLAQKGELDKAFDRLKEMRDPDSKTHEYGYLSSFLANVLKAGKDVHDRVTPVGLTRDDIIDYLPEEKLTGQCSTWDELRTKYREDKGNSRRNAEGDFKHWLQKKYHADLTTKNLRRVAEETVTPKEFLMLMNTIEALSDQMSTIWTAKSD